jgi:predicted AAA+ superfamily ATPase
MAHYQARIVDLELGAKLKALGAVLIEGPKACGKTETALQLAKSEVRLDLDVSARQAADADPALVLEGDTPRLIDEWQRVPGIWNAVRHAVDGRATPGQFILTGSAVPPDEATRHSGAGRITRLQMRPMSLVEAGVSTGAISLASLLAGEAAKSPETRVGVPEIVNEIVRGGWPALQGRPVEAAITANRGYLDEVRRIDIRLVDGVKRDPQRVGQLLTSLARHVGTHVKVTTLEADIAGSGGAVERHSIADYLQALSRLKVIEDQPAWPTHLRSKRQQREAAKRHFVDPSLAVAALRATPGRLLGDLNYLGHLFESLVVRDLRIYAQALDGEVMQYHDAKNLEADAIVQLADGRWAAFEVKIGGAEAIDEGAANIRRFAEKVDTSRSGEPACLGVITTGGYGYRRDDGVQVIPISAFGP